MNNKLAIIIPTYKQANGNTPIQLERALNSVKAQTYQNYKVFLIGDKYDHPEEVEEVIKKVQDPKIEFINLTHAKEREKYTNNKQALWCYGGVNASNFGIKKALFENFQYICHLDHDDWWSKDHLNCFNECITYCKPSWMCTKSTHLYPKNYLPRISRTLSSRVQYVKYPPTGGDVIRSSVCMNFNQIPLLYRDVFEDTGKFTQLAADEDLWGRSRIYIETHKLSSIFINSLTCYHEQEGPK